MVARFPDPPRSIRPQWLAAAQRLRTVLQARSIFLDCWADTVVASNNLAVERIAADVRKCEADLEDPGNHDWSLLYRGSVLDD